MSEMLVREKLASALPNWVDAEIALMRDGQSQSCFVLTRKGEKALLKLDREPRPAFLITREAEARVQMAAAKRGLSPTVLFADAECIVTEFLAADVLMPDAFQDSTILTRLGNLLRAVHSLPTTGRCSDLMAAAQHYANGISAQASAARALDAIDRLKTNANGVLSHGDVVAGNVLDQNGLLLIDWEYASDNSPLFDLATVIAHHGLKPSSTQRFLDAYDASGIDQGELKNYERAYHALHWLWAASRDPNQSQLDRIANNF